MRRSPKSRGHQVTPDHHATSAANRLEHRPRPNGDGLSIVVNPSAGSRRSDDLPEILASELTGARLVPVDDAGLDAAFAKAADAPVLGIVGGDGSINAAAELALMTNRPLAVFPGGTLNHFARDLGIDEVGDAVAAVQRGDLVEVDVGMIDGKPFLNTASFGSYAEFVDAREKLEGRIGKWAAAFIAAASVLWRAEPMRVEIDGTARRIWMIFIGNCEYQPPNLAPLSRSRLDDRRFDVRYVDASVPRSRTRLLVALATGRLARSSVYKRDLVPALEVRSLEGPLRLARDGETFDGGDLVGIAKHRQRLAVFAPHAHG